MSEKDLKKAVEISKNYKEDVQEHKKASFFDIDDLYSNVKELIYGLIGHKGAAPVLPDFVSEVVEEAREGMEKAGFLDGKHPAVGSAKYETEETAKTTQKPKPEPKPKPKAIADPGGGGSASPGSPEIPGLSLAMKAKAKALVKNKVVINAQHKAEVIQEEVEDGLHKREDLTRIFLFGAQKTYFWIVQTMIMFYSFLSRFVGMQLPHCVLCHCARQ